ncbi:MAG: SMI1/KNR4 family protein [Kofleriaceae bacterium]|nr:SMI1/KNR4 family protein [Myxococcales bacterium]MCB9564207.1 SMI1/KNR4 family protein [Kofleriaceae bacterium]
MTTILDSEPGLDDTALAALERTLGVALPAPYRRFLAIHSGGYPTANVFRRESRRRGDTEPGLVSEFLGAADLGLYKTIYAGRIPAEFLAIGHDPGGNALVIATSGTDAGRVYFWDHDAEHTPPTRANLYLIADDFDAFLAGLREADG